VGHLHLDALAPLLTKVMTWGGEVPLRQDAQSALDQLQHWG
jgi:hypothetical protein